MGYSKNCRCQIVILAILFGLFASLPPQLIPEAKGFSGSSGAFGYWTWSAANKLLTIQANATTSAGNTEATAFNNQDIVNAIVYYGWSANYNRTSSTQFSFMFRIVVGNGTASRPTWFVDTLKQISFIEGTVTGSSQILIDVKANGNLRFGTLVSAVSKTGKDGVEIFNAGISPYAVGDLIKGQTSSNVYLYASSFYGVASTTGQYVELLGTTARIWGCVGVQAGGISAQTNLDVFNYMITRTPFGIFYGSAGGTYDRITISNPSSQGIYFYGSLAITVKNVYYRQGSLQFLRATSITSNNYLINADSDAWTIYWTGTSSARIYRQYEFVVTVRDSEGIALQYANVTVGHYGGVLGGAFSQDFTVLTGSNGSFSPRTLSMGWYEQGYGNTLQDLNPYNITIVTIDGQRYSSIFQLSTKVDWGISLSSDVIVYATNSSNIIGNSTLTRGTGFVFQEKLFYDLGAYWAFYDDGTNYIWSHSTDGTSWHTPTTTALQRSPSNSSDGDYWTNLEGAYADGGSYADLWAGDEITYAYYHGYGYSIPNLPIKTVSVRIDAWLSGIGLERLSVQISNDGGNTWSTTQTSAYLTTSQVTYTFDFSNSFYWEISGINNDDIWVRVSQTDLATRNIFMDWIPITVTYYNDNHVIRRSDPNNNIALWNENSTHSISYVIANDLATSTGTKLFVYRLGTLQSNGDISWVASEQTVIAPNATTTFSQPSIAYDSSGYPYVGFQRKVSGSITPWVTKSNTKNGTWTTASGFPYQLNTTATYWITDIIPMTNNKIYVMYGMDQHLFGRIWNGTTWSSAETITVGLKSTLPNCVSTISINDNIYLVFLNDSVSNPRVLFTKRIYSVGSWSGYSVLANLVSYSLAPLITKISDDAFSVVWATTSKIYMKINSNGLWQNTEVLTDESGSGYDHTLASDSGITGFYQAINGTSTVHFGIMYQTSEQLPVQYTVRFTGITIDILAGPSIPTIEPTLARAYFILPFLLFFPLLAVAVFVRKTIKAPNLHH